MPEIAIALIAVATFTAGYVLGVRRQTRRDAEHTHEMFEKAARDYRA